MHQLRMKDWIAGKRDGRNFPEEEISALIRSYTAGDIPDAQMAAWLMAVYLRGMDSSETLALTRSMVDSGIRLDLSTLGCPRADKHSTGGVGDKTSLVLAPLVASSGVAVPMISGRSLGFTGGTLDKLESIPGFRVDLSVHEFLSVLERVGCAMVGQTEELAPADRKIYALRDATSTIECIPLIVASILSKKLAEDLDSLVLDVKVGNGAFMTDTQSASALAEKMVEVANQFGTRTCALITDMNQPLGFAVGNALEVSEAIATLKGDGPPDFTQLCENLATHMLLLASPGESSVRVRDKISGLIRSGDALQRFGRMIEAQGGNPRIIERSDLLPQSRSQYLVKAKTTGYLSGINTRALGLASMNLEAARKDGSAGLIIHRKIADRIEAGDPLCTIHYSSENSRESVLSQIESAFQVHQEKQEPPPLIKRMIGALQSRQKASNAP